MGFKTGDTRLAYRITINIIPETINSLPKTISVLYGY
jgi:hypothetical protein